MVFGLFGSPSRDDDDKKKKIETKKNDDDEEKTPPPPPAAPAPLPLLPIGYRSIVGSNVIVTGSSGLCGSRLIEMLLERGAKTILAFDIRPPDIILQKRYNDAMKKSANAKKSTTANANGIGGGKIIVYTGDITKDEDVEGAFQKMYDIGSNNNEQIDVCYHIAALVGPFHKYEMYEAVNIVGTERIIHMCRKYKVKKLINSSSPSTRFDGSNIQDRTEDELPYPDKWLETYAETKAKAEILVKEANNPNDGLLTISISPHQVYGPYDTLFLPSLLETAGNNNLRIFGNGTSQVSVCYVDNYCHGLMCGSDMMMMMKEQEESSENSSSSSSSMKMIPNTAILGKFYIITDDETQYFWDMINDAVIDMGFTDLKTKWHLPVWLLYMCSYICQFISSICGGGIRFKLTPFSVRMLLIDRYFNIQNAKTDLQYKPIISYTDGWKITKEWFRIHWLPTFINGTNQSAISNNNNIINNTRKSTSSSSSSNDDSSNSDVKKKDE